MNKRVVATILWFVTGWYLGVVVAYIAGVSDVLGPILAIAAAVLFGGDPFRAIWQPTSHTRAE